MKTSRYGYKQPNVAIVGCLHGNEIIGAKVIEQLEGRLSLDCSVKYILANRRALQGNSRFLESDLNRSFPWR